MATKETNPETKKTENKKKAPEGRDSHLPHEQDSLPPLPYKTCRLRVSIHCEGCKKKVRKILNSIEGVYMVNIDVKQHAVTIAGIVKPEILIMKLHKAGKYAEILPEETVPEEIKVVGPNIEEKKKKKNKKEEKSQPTTDGGHSGSKDGDAGFCGGKEPDTENTSGGDSGKCDVGSCEVDVVAPAGAETEKTCEAGGPGKEKKTVIEPASDQSPVVNESGGSKKAESGDSGNSNDNGNGDGNGGKKKKKKGQKGNSTEIPSDISALRSAPPCAPMTNQDRPSHPIDGDQTYHSPPLHQMYPYPPYYHAPPPPPVYGVSYNMVQPPASVYGASYYESPPPYSYSYVQPGYPPSDLNQYQSRPSDSFELFSDENPNACSVM